LYGKNFTTLNDYIQNNFKNGLIVLFWFCLLFGLTFAAYVLLRWVFPHGKWIHGVNENGDYFDRRLTIAGGLGIAITFWIAHKMKKL
jgi:membrane protein required for beta-lactamase induction